MFEVIKQRTKQLTGLFPHQLPRSKEEFNSFASDILSVYGLPDKSSYRNAIAMMIMNLEPTVDKMSKYHFVKSIRKAMANETAYSFIELYRKEEKEKAKEVTTANVMDEPQTAPN